MNNKKMQNRNAVKRDQLRTTISDIMMIGVSGGPGTASQGLNTDASGTFSDVWPLAPWGLTAATISGAVYSNGAPNNVERPHMRKFFNVASDFQQYRVLSGFVEWVPNTTSTSTGVIVIGSSADAADVYASAQVAYGGNYSKTFNMAGGKARVPLHIDSSWKKVSDKLTVVKTPDFDGPANNSVLIPLSTASDLCFTVVSATINNGPASTGCGYIRVVLDVEFRYPVDVNQNY